jgi:hypothetical protein
MDGAPATYRPLVIHRGRRFGWWIEGRKATGRRYMWTWWPTKGLALWVARRWVAILRRLGRGTVAVEVQDVSPPAP